MSEHIIITYSAEKAGEGHVDPNFTQLVYGDSGRKGNTIKKHLREGSYIFLMPVLTQKDILRRIFMLKKCYLKVNMIKKFNL
ncbi:hypothetical protein ABE244_25405 [Bacillus toyonensis]|uniref:hypothetical protein n=1 Tax=Bacillus toyonensis TaxID=155322 RepID=UPI003D21CD2A